MKADLNAALNYIRGTINGWTYRMYRGQLVIQRKPSFTKPWGAGTIAQRKQFGAGDAWFKKVVKPNAELAQLYRERGKAKQLNYRQMALRDFFNPPKIGNLVASGFRPTHGGDLFIAASDDFEVVRVAVVVRNRSGAVMASGDATATPENWRFSIPAPRSGNEIAATMEVSAWDRPGNKATCVFPLSSEHD